MLSASTLGSTLAPLAPAVYRQFWAQAIKEPRGGNAPLDPVIDKEHYMQDTCIRSSDRRDHLGTFRLSEMEKKKARSITWAAASEVPIHTSGAVRRYQGPSLRLDGLGVINNRCCTQVPQERLWRAPRHHTQQTKKKCFRAGPVST